MKKPKHPIGPRVAVLRVERGISQADLASAVDMTQQGIQSIEAGSVKRPGKLREIARALRTTEDYLLTGRGSKEIDADDGRAISAEFATETRPTSGIMEIDAYAGLGGGGTADGRETRVDGEYADPVKEEAWKFPARFMREELQAPESRVLIIRTQGDSMSPTILSGDRVIIDTGHRIPSPDGIYAVRDRYGSIVVKRLQVLRKGDPPRVKIISDNPHHPEEEVGADEIGIVGRVLWSLKRL